MHLSGYLGGMSLGARVERVSRRSVLETASSISRGHKWLGVVFCTSDRGKFYYSGSKRGRSTYLADVQDIRGIEELKNDEKNFWWDVDEHHDARVLTQR